MSDPLLAAWQETLGRKRDGAAIFETSGAILRTFQQIEEHAHAYQADLKIFEPGSVIAVQIGNHPDWPSILIACLRQNLVVLPLETSLIYQERQVALQICGGNALIASSAVASPVSEKCSVLPSAKANQGKPNTAAPLLYRIDHGVPPAWTSPPALLKLTSGTTALPRAIKFRSEQLLADCENICETMEISAADINFAIIPVSHSYGFSNVLTPLLARGVAMVLSSDRVPRAVLSDLARTGATVFPGMPIFYQAFCEVSSSPPLPELRLCISAAAPLTVSMADKFRRKFNQPIHSFYGSSECGGICYDREGITAEDGFVGEPVKNVQITPINRTALFSQIQVRSAAVGDGYFPEPEPDRLGAGIFVPDDLVERKDSGFKIVGRTSDIINVAGKKVNPAEIEAQLMEFEGVREAVVFGRKSGVRNEEVAACVVADANFEESGLLTFCRARLSAWQVPKQIFLLDQIPVNERGKISRRQLAARFSAE